MIYKLSKEYGGLGTIRSKEAIEQLDLMNLRKGKSYVITVNKRAIRFKVLDRFGQTVRIKILWVNSSKLKRRVC